MSFHHSACLPRSASSMGQGRTMTMEYNCWVSSWWVFSRSRISFLQSDLIEALNYSSDIRGTLRNISCPVPSFVKPVPPYLLHGRAMDYRTLYTTDYQHTAVVYCRATCIVLDDLCKLLSLIFRSSLLQVSTVVKQYNIV